MSRFLRSKLFLALVVAAIVVVGMALGRIILQNRALAREIADLQGESARLAAKNAEFVEFAKRFETDAFLEREARMTLNLQKPGEQVFVVRPGELATSSRAIAPAEQETNLDRWWRYFFAPRRSASQI